MKVPLSWLKEFLTLDLPAEKIAETLTLAGIEVEEIEKIEDDIIFSISLTPNLGHCMSILGIARELAAFLQLPLKHPSVSVKENPSSSIHGKILIHVDAKEACPRYTARLVENVRIGPSPTWVKKRLESVGFRSINNVVDAAHLVMLETGHPLHMFDFDTLEGKELYVKEASLIAPTFLALNLIPYEIPERALLICDQKKAVALAGIIGSQDSAVSETTKNVLIECAAFSSGSIRKTSKKLSLKTDAAHRFERGIDREQLPYALNKAAFLLQELAGGTVASGIIDQKNLPYHPLHLTCRISRVNRLLGCTLSAHEVTSLLARLDIRSLRQEGDLLHVAIPSFRNDITSEVDLIEEVGRLYGFHRLPKSPPKHLSSPLLHAPLFLFENNVRTRLISAGLQECITCDLISPALAEITAERELSKEHLISVLHPCSIDQSVLRASLLPGLLQVVKFNCDHGSPDISAFELGRVHFKDKEHYREFSSVGIVLSGKHAPYFFDPKPKEIDFFDIKGYVENFLESLDIQDIAFSPSHLLNFHPQRQAWILHKNHPIGALGEVHPAHLLALKIEQRVFFAALNVHDLLHIAPSIPQASPLPQFPGSERDWTLTLPEKLHFQEILQAIHAVPSVLLENVLLLDIYRGKQVGEGKKNVTLRFFYRDRKKTLEIEAVEKEHAKITQEVAKKLSIC